MRFKHDAISAGNVRMVAGATSLGRVLAGVAAFVRPETLPRVLGMDRGTARRSAPLVRMFASREAALGAGALYALRTGRDVTPWLVAQAVGDAGDALALAAAARARHVDSVRGTAIALSAAGGVVAGLLAIRALRD